jgi:PAS domain S-box-containing protein
MERGDEATRMLDASRSGVRRAVSFGVIEELGRELKSASQRVVTLRERVGARARAAPDELHASVLHEIDTAHEELHVVEEELRAQADEIFSTREALDAERRRYRELFNAAPEAYCVTDLHGMVIEANRRTGELFHLDPTFIATRPLAGLVAPPDRRKFRDLLDSIGGAVVEAELRFRPPQGMATWVLISAQRATGVDGHPTTIRWLLRNIQQQKEEELRGSQATKSAEQALRDRLGAVESEKRLLEHFFEREQDARRASDLATRQMERVLTEVAHELRTPIGSIAGWVRILGQGRGVAGEHRRGLMSMTRSIRALARLTEELIENARFEQHKVALDVTGINLLRVVIEVLEDLRPLAELKHIQLEFSAHPHKIDVRGDALRLHQVFRNLIGNAIKFTPEQGAIRTSISIVDRHAEVAITDTGCGIAKDALASIFTPFGSGMRRRASNGGGLGLGLSIAKRLVELHDGIISAQSPGMDRGATFRVRLPLLGSE